MVMFWIVYSIRTLTLFSTFNSQSFTFNFFFFFLVCFCWSLLTCDVICFSLYHYREDQTMHPIITTYTARIFQRHTLSTRLITMVIMGLHHTCTQASQATHTCMGHHHHTHVTALHPLYMQQVCVNFFF